MNMPKLPGRGTILMWNFKPRFRRLRHSLPFASSRKNLTIKRNYGTDSMRRRNHSIRMFARKYGTGKRERDKERDRDRDRGERAGTAPRGRQSGYQEAQQQRPFFFLLDLLRRQVFVHSMLVPISRHRCIRTMDISSSRIFLCILPKTLSMIPTWRIRSGSTKAKFKDAIKHFVTKHHSKLV